MCMHFVVGSCVGITGKHGALQMCAICACLGNEAEHSRTLQEVAKCDVH